MPRISQKAFQEIVDLLAQGHEFAGLHFGYLHLSGVHLRHHHHRSRAHFKGLGVGLEPETVTQNNQRQLGIVLFDPLDDADASLVEIGGCHDFIPQSLRIGAGIGKSYVDQDLAFSFIDGFGGRKQLLEVVGVKRQNERDDEAAGRL